MLERMTGLFPVEGYMPHGMCYLWQPGLMTLHAASDGLIGLAYIAIASMLAWLVARGRREMPFRTVFAAFGAFIVTCGLTHLLAVYTLWEPIYWVSGGVKAVTAVASVATAVMLPGVIPGVLSTVHEATLSRGRRAELEATVAELRESENRFREAFERAPIGKGLVALDGAWLRVNPALCEVTGYGEAELLGMSLQGIVHPDDQGEDTEQARRLVQGEIGSYQVEKRLVRKDGRVVTALSGTSVVRDEADLPLYFIVQLLDVTERKEAQLRERQLAQAEAARGEAEMARNRMEFLAQASSVLGSSLDYEATLQSVARLAVPVLGDYCVLDLVEENGAVRRVAAAHADPAREAVAQEVRRYPPRDLRSPALTAIRSGESVILDEASLSALMQEPALQTLAGSLEPRASLSVPLSAHDRVLGALTVVLDARSRRRFGPTEVALAQEIAHRAAAAVENARLFHRAEEANLAKSDFLAVMSHELRTPLNAIVGYTDLLQARVPGMLNEQQATYLERISRSAAHLLGLIEEVLTYARLEAGRESVRRDAVALDELVRQASALVEPLAAERGLRFEVVVPDHDVRLETDARKLQQMLANLLSNAVKFTDSGQVLLVAEEQGEEAVFTITDTGIGIAPEHIEQVFDAFWQAESATTRRVQGTGLGLGVTRRLARLLGGDVTVRSEPGQGSTFTLRVPRRAPTG